MGANILQFHDDILQVLETTSTIEPPVRRSVSLPADVAGKLAGIAEARHVSQDRALVDLIKDGIAAYEQRRAEFLDLADRFRRSTDPAEADRLREELARMTFGG